ncbi:MAG TPA: FMN-binding protein [Solirubrobacteraceae bacterium]|jgi:uncharacterized protein with FMN-binding domain|nr:FMN-binding protein [Solirubrobacteraceae bacterium]
MISARMIMLAVPAAPLALGLAGCGQTKVADSTRPALTGPTSSAAATGALKSGSYTGQAVDTRYGTVQVAVTVGGGRITGVNFLALPEDRQRSQVISSEATPLLRSEALQAQSGNVNLLSGATYTSEGFAQSLQSALASAR